MNTYNNSDMPTYYPIYSLSMANYLVRTGFDIVKIDDNINNNKYKTLYFYDSPQLRKAMTAFKKQEV